MPTQISRGGWQRKGYNGAGQVVQTQSGSADSLSIQDDVVKPPKRRRPKVLDETAYDRTHVVIRYPKGFHRQYLVSSGLKSWDAQGQMNHSGSLVLHADMRGPAGWWDIQDAGADIESVATTKALNKLRTNGSERETTFDPGVAWRERNELGMLYRDVSSRTVNGLNAVKQLDFNTFSRLMKGNLSPAQAKKKFTDAVGGLSKKSLRAPGALANGWLALKLGYLPFLSDLHGAAEALAYRQEKHHWDIEVRARATRREAYHKRLTSGNAQNKLLCRTVISETLTRSSTVGFTVSVDDAFDHHLAQLGLNNPASLLYESTPLTFVADYFFDLGNWLSALGAPLGTKFKTGFSTRYIEWTMVNTDGGEDPASRWYGHARRVKWKRSVLTNFPIPIAPLAPNPSGLNAGKISTLAALAYSRFMPRGGPGTDFSSRSTFRFTD